MTQIGKCDTCRARKVKCDEKKPKCGACRKKDRPCTYTYGRASALVLESPTKYSGHGKAKVAPRVVPLVYQGVSSDSDSQSSSDSPQDPAVEEIGRGDSSEPIMEPWHAYGTGGVEMPLWSSISGSPATSASSLSLIRPLSPEMSLAARFIQMIGPQSGGNPFLVNGSWVHSIPSRIGSHPAFDLAVKYAIDSFTFYSEPSFSKQQVARISRGKALKALREGLECPKGKLIPFHVLLAIKFHFHGEIFMGVDNWINYTTHSMALADILKSRQSMEILNEDYFSFLDSTYMDEVAEAAFGGRQSKFENDFYLSLTRNPPTRPDGGDTLLYRASMAVMHVMIQIPSLVLSVRDAINAPDDVNKLATAVTRAEALWSLNPWALLDEYFLASTEMVPMPPSPKIEDMIATDLHFISVEAIMLLTRYWSFVIYLSGLTHALYDHFPAQSMASLLPDMDTVEKEDIGAASNVLRSINYATSVSPALPLVPLRVLTPMQTSLGAWNRKLRRLEVAKAASELGSAQYAELVVDFDRYERCQNHVVDESNKIHAVWGAEEVTMPFFAFAIGILEGKEIPPILLKWLKDVQAGKDVPQIAFRLSNKVVEIRVKTEDGIPGMPRMITRDPDDDDNKLTEF